MAGTMSEADLVTDLKATLSDSARVFVTPGDADFKRFLQDALSDMQVKRPVTRLGTLTLIADQANYSLAAFPSFVAYKIHQWGDGKMPKPWDDCYPGALPRVHAVDQAGDFALVFSPAPTARQIAALGSKFDFWYYGEHRIGETAPETTIKPVDRALLLLRAQAEAMRELAVRNAGKPVQMRDGMSGAPRNSTPAALYKEFLDQFWRTR